MLGIRKGPRTVSGLELETGNRMEEDREGEHDGRGQSTRHGASGVEACLLVLATMLALQRCDSLWKWETRHYAETLGDKTLC